jgi:hypothetical protein
MEIALTGIAQVTGGGQPVGTTVFKWGKAIDRELNSLGSDGWQLVTIWKFQFGDKGCCDWMTFKRPSRG